MLKPSRLYATYYRASEASPWTRVRQDPQPKEQADVDAVIRRKAGWKAVVVEADECPECGDDAMEAIQGDNGPAFQCGTCCVVIDRPAA